jgi:hypothetical protein
MSNNDLVEMAITALDDVLDENIIENYQALLHTAVSAVISLVQKDSNVQWEKAITSWQDVLLDIRSGAELAIDGETPKCIIPYATFKAVCAILKKDGVCNVKESRKGKGNT